MGRNCALISVLLLTVLTVTRGQYFDILQGLQQLFQPYPANDYVTNNYGVTRNPSTHRHPNRQENKKKTNEQRNHTADRRVKKPPTYQFEYVFGTTQKPIRKTTKSHSSQSNNNSSNNNSNRQYSNIVFSDYFNPYELTTKVNKVNRVKTTSSTTTTEVNYINNDYNENRATTENVFKNVNNNNRVPNNNFNINRPVTENVFENVNHRDNYGVNNYDPNIVFNNQNNRRPDNFNNNNNEYSNNYSSVPNIEYPQVINSNQNNRRPNNENNNSRRPSNENNNNNRRPSNDNNNNRGFINTDYNNDFPRLPTNTRNPNVIGINPLIDNNRGIVNNNRYTNNFGVTTSGLINTDNPYPNNFGITKPNNRVVPNEYDNRGNTNNFAYSTGIELNYKGSSYDSVNRGTSNNYSNRGNTYDPNRRVPNFNYPSDNPLINRPGVQPAPIDIGQPPITNRPVQDGNNFFAVDQGSLSSGGEDLEPEILIGPDEDDMSDAQKRRYVDLAERVCNNYKTLTVKKVVALPLLPSPDPVEVNVTDCTPINVPLVIGGKIVSIKEFPHMALVGWRKTRNSGYSWKCGGSLISELYVLTAGHCTYQEKDYDVVSGPPQAVQLGSSYLDDPGAVIVKIAAVIRHPKYKMRRSYHDIALIKLVSKVQFSDVVRPACLGVPPPEGDRFVATGWGRTEFGGDHSKELRSVSLPIWNMQECREIWGTSLKLPSGVTPDSHVCAGDAGGGRDTCQGDSGGPAQVQDGCLWRLVAVTSFGRSCGAPGTPALYAVIPKAFVAAQAFTDQR